MRAAIYARLSRDTEESTSIARQREACEQFCAARGWTITATAEDVDVSGSKVAPWDRPGFASLLARSDVDVIVSYRLDRMARNVIDFAALVQRLDASSTALASATEPLDTSQPTGRAMLWIVATFAEMESEAISARVTGAIRTLRHSARWSHGQAPYGYRIVSAEAGKTLAVDDAEAAVIRDAAARVIAGEPVYRVAESLNAAGVKPRRAERWTSTALGKLLAGDSLLGRVTHRGALVRNDDGTPAQPFPAILTVAESEALREAVKPRRTAGERSRHALSGLCICASCGATLNVNTQSDGTRAYRCSRGKAGGCAAPASMRADWAEDWAERAMLERFGSTAVRVTARSANRAGLADIARQIAAVGQQITQARGAERASLLDVLDSLQARQDEMQRAPERATVPLLDDEGHPVTMAEVYSAQPEHARHEQMRATLAEAGLRVRIARATAGTRTLDESRLALVEMQADEHAA